MTAPISSATTARPVLARFLKNVGWVFSSQAVVALCGIVAMAAAARALGADGVAVVALVEAYMRLVALLVHLEPWQAVIRFGSEALERGESSRLRTLIAFSTTVDIVLGLAAGLIAFLLAGLAAPLLGLGDRIWLLHLAACGIALALRPTGVALLRLFDRFDLLARIEASTAVGRALLTVAVAAAGAGPGAFVMVLVLYELLDGTLIYVLGRREMVRQLPRGRADSPFRAPGQDPGLLRVFLNSNLQFMLRQSTQRLDVILLGALASTQAVGFYHIARRSAEAGLRLGRPLAQAVYPELARFAAARQTGRLARFLTGVSGTFALGLALVLLPVLIWIEPLIVLAFGETFRGAAQVVGLQIVAAAILLAGLGIVPAMLSLDGDVRLLLLRLAITLGFFSLFWPMVARFGAEGAAATHLICNAAWLFAGALMVRGALGRHAAGAS